MPDFQHGAAKHCICLIQVAAPCYSCFRTWNAFWFQTNFSILLILAESWYQLVASHTFLSLLDEKKHLKLRSNSSIKYQVKWPFWASFYTNVPLNVIQHAWSKILHDKLDGKTFSQCQTWKSKRQAYSRRRTRRQKSNNSYGKYLAVEWRQHFTYAAVYVDCVENKEWKKKRGGNEREERIWFRGKKMCEERVTAEVCGPSLMQIAAIFLCLWLRFS